MTQPVTEPLAAGGAVSLSELGDLPRIKSVNIMLIILDLDVITNNEKASFIGQKQ